MRARCGNEAGNNRLSLGGLNQGGANQGGSAGRSGSEKRPGDNGHLIAERAIAGRGNYKLHARTCSVCGHSRRKDIEREFLAWRSPKEIVKEYKLGNRAAVYRHAHALGLMERRYVDLRAALGRIIERAGEVPVTAWAVVAAVRACAKINARGQWMERGESNQMRELLDGMNREELLAYAEEGKLPDWFQGTDVAASALQAEKPHAEEGADA